MNQGAGGDEEHEARQQAMASDYLESEIEKQRRRARKLQVDDLICNVFLTEGLRHYASWSQDPDWRCPSISDVRESSQLGSLGFTLKGRRYSIRFDDDLSHPSQDPQTIHMKLSLLADGNLVLSEIVEQRMVDDIDAFKPLRVSTFIEGEWIEDFRKLEREMKQVAKHNLRRIKRERAERRRAASAGSLNLKKMWQLLVRGNRAG